MKKFTNMKVLSEDNFYDGKLSGLCIHEGKIYYYCILPDMYVTEMDLNEEREYNIFKVPDDELIKVLAHNAVWNTINNEYQSTDGFADAKICHENGERYDVAERDIGGAEEYYKAELIVGTVMESELKQY